MNFGTPVPLLIGIILILGALALFFLEKFRPGYERDSDKVYAVLLLISGLFLLAHLDMELLASFQQLLLTGMLTTLLIESVRSRLPNTDPMRPDNRMDPPRPPRPRYDERPPIRRGYRAELDDRGMLREQYPPGTPRMNPAREASWDEYAPAGRARQPYEEYREPAGRLQPSRRPNPTPPDNRYSDNERYGQRPPAPRSPQDRPSQDRPPQDRSSAPRPPQGSSSQGRPPQQGRPPERPPESGQRRPDREGEQLSARPANGAEQNGRSNDRSAETSRERPAKGDRALDVLPYSEAPKLDDDYRPKKPEGTPTEY